MFILSEMLTIVKYTIISQELMRIITKTTMLASVIVIAALLTFSLNMNVSEAVPSSESPSHMYGVRTANIICGDHMCNEQGTISSVNPENVLYDAPTPDHLVSIKTISSQHLGDKDPNAYLNYYKVDAGDKDVKNIRLVIQSDIEHIDTHITSIFAEDSSVLVVRIHAIDPGSITARISGYQIS